MVRHGEREREKERETEKEKEREIKREREINISYYLSLNVLRYDYATVAIFFVILIKQK